MKYLSKFNEGWFSSPKDEDLGKEILLHLDNMSDTYINNNTYDKKVVNKYSTDWYFFMDKVFEKSQEDHKVDVIKHLDYKTKSNPEYTVSISKNVPKKDGRLSGQFSLRNTSGGKSNKDTYSNEVVDKSESLDISQSLAKKIFTRCEYLHNSITKNIKDDARGK